MSEGFDYSFSRPDPACLAKTGDFVVRYVGTPQSGKNLTPNEKARLEAVGLSLVGVYETTQGFMVSTYHNGAMAGIAVQDDYKRFGVRGDRPCYFALDIDPAGLSASAWLQVQAFLDGAASILGRQRLGIYGGFAAIDRLVPTLCPFGWQTYAWSHGKFSSKAQLYQYANSVTMCGGAVDKCKSFKPDFGQWDYTPSVPVTPGEVKEKMFLFSGPGTPVWFVHDGKSVGLNESTDLTTFLDNKTPWYKLDDDTYKKFRTAYPGV